MYKCKNCGNTEKFIGTVSETGSAFIYQDRKSGEEPPDYSWIYYLSDNCWRSSMKIHRCYYCKSEKITRV